MKFFTDIILQGTAKLQAKLIQLESLASPPETTAVSGALYYDNAAANDSILDVDVGTAVLKQNALKVKTSKITTAPTAIASIASGGISGSSLISCDVSVNHNLSVGDSITISGVTGTYASNYNKSFTVVKVGNTYSFLIMAQYQGSLTTNGSFIDNAANKDWQSVFSSYYTQEVDGYVRRRANMFGSRLLNINPVPKFDFEAASKYYVDSVAQKLVAKQAVYLASTASVATTGTGLTSYDISGKLTVTASGYSLDGVVLTNNMRVLLKDQSISYQNGIYVYTVSGSVGTFTRAEDADGTKNEYVSAYVLVEAGVTLAGNGYICNFDAAVYGNNLASFNAAIAAKDAWVIAGAPITNNAGGVSFEDKYNSALQTGGASTDVSASSSIGTVGGTGTTAIVQADQSNFSLYIAYRNSFRPTGTLGSLPLIWQLFVKSPTLTLTKKVYTPSTYAYATSDISVSNGVFSIPAGSVYINLVNPFNSLDVDISCFEIAGSAPNKTLVKVFMDTVVTLTYIYVYFAGDATVATSSSSKYQINVIGA